MELSLIPWRTLRVSCVWTHGHTPEVPSLGPAQPELPQPLWNAWHGLGAQREAEQNHPCSRDGVQQLLCQGATESSSQRLLGRDFPVPPESHTRPGFAQGVRQVDAISSQQIQIQLLQGRSSVPNLQHHLHSQTFPC